MNCKNCKKQWCSLVGKDHEMSFECKGYIGKTNADLIRAMSDEGLAEWIDHIQADSYERGMMETPVVDYPNIYSGWLSWLKSPMEVDE